MFAVVYKFRVKPGFEEQFEHNWALRTEELKRDAGALGSRLHLAEDGTYIAYANWPSKQTWENSGGGSDDSDARKKMKETLEGGETLHCMNLVKDLLSKS